MFLPIDPGSGLPIYRQIAEQVRRMVASGGLAAGDRVPSVRDLAQTLQINPLTVAKSYQELEQAGVLESRRGLGMFVAAAARDGRAKAREGLRPAAERFALDAAQAGLTPAEAAALVEECARRIARGKGKP